MIELVLHATLPDTRRHLTLVLSPGIHLSRNMDSVSTYAWNPNNMLIFARKVCTTRPQFDILCTLDGYTKELREADKLKTRTKNERQLSEEAIQQIISKQKQLWNCHLMEFREILDTSIFAWYNSGWYQDYEQAIRDIDYERRRIEYATYLHAGGTLSDSD